MLIQCPNDAYKGSYTLAFADDNGWNGLSVVVGAKGKINVSGTLANGKKVGSVAVEIK